MLSLLQKTLRTIIISPGDVPTQYLAWSSITLMVCTSWQHRCRLHLRNNTRLSVKLGTTGVIYVNKASNTCVIKTKIEQNYLFFILRLLKKIAYWWTVLLFFSILRIDHSCLYALSWYRLRQSKVMSVIILPLPLLTNPPARPSLKLLLMYLIQI